MTSEDPKFKNIVPWIASVAISILCCSVIFVLFASFLVDIKDNLKESNTRLGLIEARQDAIVSDLEVMRKHTVLQPSVAPPVESSAPVPPEPSTAPAAGQPPVMPTPAPTVAAPSVPAPSATQPSITVPVMPATPETK